MFISNSFNQKTGNSSRLTQVLYTITYCSYMLAIISIQLLASYVDIAIDILWPIMFNSPTCF